MEYIVEKEMTPYYFGTYDGEKFKEKPEEIKEELKLKGFMIDTKMSMMPNKENFEEWEENIRKEQEIDSKMRELKLLMQGLPLPKDAFYFNFYVGSRDHEVKILEIIKNIIQTYTNDKFDIKVDTSEKCGILPKYFQKHLEWKQENDEKKRLVYNKVSKILSENNAHFDKEHLKFFNMNIRPSGMEIIMTEQLNLFFAKIVFLIKIFIKHSQERKKNMKWNKTN